MRLSVQDTGKPITRLANRGVIREKKQPAVSTVIRQTAKKYGYEATKHKGLWYIGNMACPPRLTPREGLTDEQALVWLHQYKDQ